MYCVTKRQLHLVVFFIILACAVTLKRFNKISSKSKSLSLGGSQLNLVKSKLDSSIDPSIFSLSNEAKATPMVILPGFGNDAIDYKNPLDRYELETVVNIIKHAYLHIYSLNIAE